MHSHNDDLNLMIECGGEWKDCPSGWWGDVRMELQRGGHK